MRSTDATPANVLSDEAIIELYWQRDESAIRETDYKYRAYLSAIARNILQDESDCEECLNDAYLRAWTTIPPKRPQSLRAYLAKILRSLSIDCYRHRTRQKRVPSECTVSLDELSETLMGSSTVNEEYESSVISRVISDYLRGLGERDMCLFIGRYFCSDTIPALAERTGLSESGVKKALLRLREELREQLEKEGIQL